MPLLVGISLVACAQWYWQLLACDIAVEVLRGMLRRCNCHTRYLSCWWNVMRASVVWIGIPVVTIYFDSV